MLCLPYSSSTQGHQECAAAATQAHIPCPPQSILCPLVIGTVRTILEDFLDCWALTVCHRVGSPVSMAPEALTRANEGQAGPQVALFVQ